MVWMAGILALCSWGADDLVRSQAQVFSLDNGLTVVLEENHRTDQIALHLHYDIGSRDELDGERGLAHLFEHLMFEGSAHVPGAAFDEWLTSAGGQNNAYTSEDETAYHETFPSGALDLALFLESDRLAFLEAALTEENLSNQQSIVLQERARGYNEPNGRDWDALSRLMFPVGHPYHVPVIGTVADIEGVTLDGVKQFFRKHYRTEGAVLGLVGHFDTEKALERVKFWFEDVPSRPMVSPRKTEVKDVATRARAGLQDPAVDDSTLYLAWRTVPKGHADELPLELAAWVLSGGRGTRLDDQVYYKSNLAVDDGVYAWSSELDGVFLVYVKVDAPPLNKMETVVLKSLMKLVKKAPTEAEMHRAKRSIVNGWMSQLERPDSRVQWLVDCQRLTGSPDCLKDKMAALEAVSSEDVREAVLRWLGPEKRVVLSVVPESVSLGALETVVLP
jgi:zinc protease